MSMAEVSKKEWRFERVSVNLFSRKLAAISSLISVFQLAMQIESWLF